MARAEQRPSAESRREPEVRSRHYRDALVALVLVLATASIVVACSKEPKPQAASELAPSEVPERLRSEGITCAGKPRQSALQYFDHAYPGIEQSLRCDVDGAELALFGLRDEASAKRTAGMVCLPYRSVAMPDDTSPPKEVPSKIVVRGERWILFSQDKDLMDRVSAKLDIPVHRDCS